MNEQKYILSLIKCPQLGPKRLKLLFNFFNSAEAAFTANQTELELAGLDEKTAWHVIEERKKIDPERELEIFQKSDVKLVADDDERYPELLKQIHAPPPFLFVKGKLPANDRLFFAVVGTRVPTRYGLEVIEQIIPRLATSGLAIVSGLAFGIDAAAHKATLGATGTTLAVLGSGVDSQSIAPQTNLRLAHEIVTKGGALISEYPLGTPGYKSHFPIRNRIISGMCAGTLVVEGTIKSGSLITARAALDQNRDVFAVPGPITSDPSSGPNNLIKMGARPVTCPEDVLDVLNVESRMSQHETQTVAPDTKEEALILPLLDKAGIHVDQIIATSKIASSEINGILTLMEMKGKVRHIGNGYYVHV